MKRMSAVEVDVAVIRTSFATKEDVQSLRNEIHASTERIIGLLHEHKLEFNNALAKQREEFKDALAKQREDFFAALSAQREEFKDALANQRDEFKDALVEQRITLYNMQMSHMWKLYGFASLLMTGVYFIARYVH
ncbi:hypothetical protein NHH73_18280 [Oxalobacteraceae bacterium OTU3CINTB1]|nr:hypothetical protein NHH73_18280 [Oxalobacteraceae bacterium OTU3CINTB1]